MLIELLWGFDLLTSSPMRLWSESFEQSTMRRGFAQRVALLESGGWVETTRGPNLERLVRLTEAGRIAVLGRRDLLARWNRVWDQLWRFLIYDVSVDQRALRQAMRRELKRLHFGRIQGSAWLSPDQTDHLKAILRGTAIDPRSLLIITGRPDGGETDQDLVQQAWDFPGINRNYERYLDHIQTVDLTAGVRPPAIWRETEARLWARAVGPDPMLPRALWPPGYLGEEALLARSRMLTWNH